MNDGLYPHNKFGHGIMYYAFSICMILYYLIILSVIFYTSRKERKRNKKIQLYYLLAGCTCVLIGLLLFQSGITRGYDTTSLAYVICIILITIVMSKYDLLDTLELVRNYVADNLSLGIVALDTDDLIIYYNQPLNHIYPDFKTNESDIVNSLITSFQSNQVVKIDDKVYQPEYKELFKGTKYMGHIITLSDITDSYNYARLMKKMTETDSLTGLSNRFAYEYQISELKKNEHLPDNLILFSIDINGLKSVNDSSGHGIGDSLIYDAAQCISNVMTQYGKCFRMGGDEFAAIITNDQANPLTIKKMIEENTKNYNNNNYKISISVGYGSYKDHRNMNIEELEKLADEMMLNNPG